MRLFKILAIGFICASFAPTAFADKSAQPDKIDKVDADAIHIAQLEEQVMILHKEVLQSKQENAKLQEQILSLQAARLDVLHAEIYKSNQKKYGMTDKDKVDLQTLKIERQPAPASPKAKK